ncbi:double-strand break repair helicase AddA [Poseidonocella sp. HB161398]|uniref:double-strand break repair helicase AddA n=1 Tax=Poseidonocella sp. HB161398 TaxID=2320855 RepID=UPI001107D413|nr:double-strand break repair helicase AddA [Poseidonocella sp. HB161398]
MTAVNEATRRQIEAARPGESTWLAANAGSGKTRVLTNRVARLLLSGVAPQNVLCLTYTKAAASEMQNRLFQTLGEWAMRPDAALRADLEKLGETGLDEERLLRARRLFARAIETPGGLKIQTIHSFCAALLRRFPLEAGVSPQFTEIDERTQAAMIERVVEEMADGPEAGLIDAMALQMGGEDIAGLSAQILHARADFARLPDEEALWETMGLLPGQSEADLVDCAFAPGDRKLLETLVPVLQSKGGNDGKAGAALARLAPFVPSMGLLKALEGPFLFGATAKTPFGPKTGSFPTKPTRAALGPELMEALDGLMSRVADARTVRLALTAAKRTAVLHRYAAALLPRVEAAKLARGWLDFDDLILRTRALLTDPAVAQWVLYKLDGGIDHILVDEAQDTSPEQWDVIRLLAQEFTAGEGTRGEVPRTIFVVGDKKQSIYSFQGADPREFDRMRGHFGTGLAAIGATLHSRGLAHSFRSAEAVLSAVDRTFPGVSGLGDPPEHVAFRSELPGRVDLWPAILPEKESGEEENADGWDPVDRLDPESPTAQLAQAVAKEVRELVDSAHLPAGSGKGRRIHEGDILVLFRRRGDLFFETMRALKAEGLEVAGADRIKLGEELAVRDLLALLAFLALPEDDLSLAAALRSPIFGWTEDDLFRLAHPRPAGSYLWTALRQAEMHPDTFAILDDLRNLADLRRPYDLLDRILTRHRGRARLIARLGPECEEAIDGLLQQALDYEQAEIPSLTGFLEWMAAEDVEIKRQAEAAGRAIRLMTVHGSKGLEAPVVILPDCAAFRNSGQDILLPREGSWPAWRLPRDELPPALMQAAERVAQAEAEERDRLLYVAMTRAEQWLIVAAAGKLGQQTTWYGQVQEGLVLAGARALSAPTGQGLRLETGDWAVAEPREAEAEEEAARPALPAWLRQTAKAPEHALPTLAPSGLGGAKALPGEGGDEETALRTGRQIHLLLEHLAGHPAAARGERAAEILAEGPDAAGGAALEAVLAEAAAVLDHPALLPFFAPETLAEVPLSAHVPALGRVLYGTIDRLQVTGTEVLAVDFKTNRTVPERPEEVPEGLLRQMGAYAAMLGAVYPGKRISTALLWTRTATLMPLPHDLVMAALLRSTPTS